MFSFYSGMEKHGFQNKDWKSKNTYAFTLLTTVEGTAAVQKGKEQEKIRSYKQFFSFTDSKRLNTFCPAKTRLSSKRE